MAIRLKLLFVLMLSSTLAFADGGLRYEVSITNITQGQTFTPQLVVTHKGSVRLFTLGDPASVSLEILAEGGDTVPLTSELEILSNQIGEVKTIPGLLGPGETANIIIHAGYRQRYLSIAAMLIPTNDTFVALNRVRLPYRGKKSYTALAYDAGTEANDQNCANIPGPRCIRDGEQGEGHSPGPNEGDEGYVYVSNGFHDLGNADEAGNEILSPSVYDWRNPVARVTVRRAR